MPTQTRGTTYEEAVRITHVYLGPAAGRFVDRQVRNHLHKEPESMTRKDLAHLIDWIQIAVSLLTDDVHVVEEYIRRLEQLTHPSQP